MSPTRGYGKAMAARRRLRLEEVKVRDAVVAYDDDDRDARYEAAQTKQEADEAIDSMVDASIERALLGD